MPKMFLLLRDSRSILSNRFFHERRFEDVFTPLLAETEQSPSVSTQLLLILAISRHVQDKPYLFLFLLKLSGQVVVSAHLSLVRARARTQTAVCNDFDNILRHSWVTDIFGGRVALNSSAKLRAGLSNTYSAPSFGTACSA